MSAALGLLRLQQVDSRLAQVEGRLEQIRAALENATELAAARAEVDQCETKQLVSERARRDAEAEAQNQRTKIEQAESSLYGGGVRTPKELQELQADVVSLKKHLTLLEERELEDMIGLEAAENELLAARHHLEEVQARFAQEHAELFQEQQGLERDRLDLQTERAAAVAPIGASTLTTYEELRRSHRGVAVAEVSENGCGACGTTLTAALQQTARHATQLVLCPACGRILYGG